MTSSVASIFFKSEQGMKISGDVVFANVSILLEQSREFFQADQTADFVIDCTEMRRIDSAGISLLLEWQRQCSNNNKVCRFSGLSDQAQSLIKAYRLQPLIAA